MEWQTLGRQTLDGAKAHLQTSLKKTHGWMLLFSAIILCSYLPIWFGKLLEITLNGGSAPFINLCFLYLGIATFWKHRKVFGRTKLYTDDRLIGYAILITGILGFVLSRSSISFQAISAMLVVLGMVISSWGVNNTIRIWLYISLLLVSLYPDLIYISNQIWRFITPHNTLENLMAYLGSRGLQVIGYQASSSAEYVTLPAGAVQVATGCSGFEMSLILAAFGFIMGLFVKLSRKETVVLMVLGVLLALVCNIPRIMLLAIASVYWGKDSFEFWHGSIGGQIFAGILFTIYYYLAMGIIDRKPKVKMN